MPDAHRCPSCGAERPAAGPEGLCPRCLMQQAFDTDPPVSAGASVLNSLAATVGPVPHVLLRDDTASGAPPSPVLKPSSPEMPDLPDRSARLQLFGEIARGGMGAVLRGRDIDLGRDLAVKVLLESHQHKPELVRRFVEEAQIGGQLQHPGVVPVYELGAFADRRPFFTMKLVKGRTLAELLQARSSPDEDRPRLLGIFAQVCQTMAYTHARGVIHRDLKPSNIMVGSFGEVQVMDWGLAKVLPKGGAENDEAGEDPAQDTIIATARSGEGSDLSQAGSVMGTPAYMAPEQARGEVTRVDERADVFALGSILCEVLTGRAAFTGRSPGEIHRKAALGDLADAYGQIDTCGADAELIALARDALAREREERPRDADVLAMRLTAHLAGVQERLRQAELARARADARAEEERKRRKLTLALAAAVVALMAVGGGGAAVYWQQRQARAARLAVALRDVELLRDQAQSDPQGDPDRWRAAVAAADRLEPMADTRSRRRVRDLQEAVRRAADAAEADARLLRAAVDIRSAEADDPDGSTSDAAYAQAFRGAGLEVDALGPEAAGARIRARPAGVALALAAALDDWAGRRRLARSRDEAAWGGLIAAARAADPDPTRDRLRALWAPADRKAQRGPLLELAKQADPQGWAPASLILLAEALYAADGRDAAIELLRRAQAHQPGDVWLSYRLAAWLEAMHPPRMEEAIGYYRAARALRPETAHSLAHLLEARGRGEEASAVYKDLVRLRPGDGRHWGCYGRLLKARGDRAGAAAALEKSIAACRETIRLQPELVLVHNSLGLDLCAQGKPAEAEAAFREAIRSRPDLALIHSNLGTALLDRGKLAEAEAAFREAIRLQPDFALPRNNLGIILVRRGKPAEAEVAFREAIRLQPEYASAHSNLSGALRDQGKPAEAVAEAREAIRLKPDDALAHYNMGNTLRDQGKVDEAIAEFRESIRHQPDYSWAYNNLGVILCTMKHDYTKGEAAFREAIRFQPDYARAHNGLATALLSQGRPAEAIAEFGEAVRFQPGNANAHIDLGQALKQQGRFREALDELRQGHELGSKRPDWRIPSAEWVRQAERLVDLEARLPALERGEVKSGDGDEGIARADMAHELKRHGLAARLYVEAFRADPTLAQGINSANCYNAACAAALAAAGRGMDPLTDDKDKARWRKQAIDWLRTDLAFWAGQGESGKPGTRAVVAQELTHWKVDPDLAGLRDAAAVKVLPEDEQKSCRALWADVEALLVKVRRP